MWGSNVWMVLVYLCVCCSYFEARHALDSLAADCETSVDGSVVPPGVGIWASVALLCLPLRTQPEWQPIWSLSSCPNLLSRGQLEALPETARAAGWRGLAEPLGRWWSAAGARGCQPSSRRCPGRAAAFESSSRDRAACRGAPPYLQNSCTEKWDLKQYKHSNTVQNCFKV